MGPMNRIKNKLNTKIRWQKSYLLNGHLECVWIPLNLLKTENTVAK